MVERLAVSGPMIGQANCVSIARQNPASAIGLTCAGPCVIPEAQKVDSPGKQW
ncbi:GL10240 [Drosophila persimilis]|uniref:GL10240 n=1 Tax=Drosophila persimilis TaxID=7234 RepID=B4IRU9_DROPE|nr:GL10240 [Drosophila persimilis]